jgi:hypothetical protein
LKETDRDIRHELDQLLPTPNARRRAGIKLVIEEKQLSQLELLTRWKDGKISQEEYERVLQAPWQAREPELREPTRTGLLEDMQDASLRISPALLSSDDAARRQQGCK